MLEDFFIAAENGETAFRKIAAVRIEKAPRRMECTRNFIDRNRFIYIIKGEITFRIGEQTVHAVPGDVVFIRAFTEYRSEWTKDGNDNLYDSVLFDCDLTNTLPPLSVICHDGSDGIRHLYEELLSTYLEAQFGYKMAMVELFFHLLRLLRLASEKASIRASYDAILPGVLAIRNKYAGNISLADIANECHMSERNFRRVFRAYAGMSPVSYIRLLRIEKAKDLLQNGKYSISEVAAVVNIPDVYYFSRLFKRETGISPAQYAKRR